MTNFKFDMLQGLNRKYGSGKIQSNKRLVYDVLDLMEQWKDDHRDSLGRKTKKEIYAEFNSYARHNLVAKNYKAKFIPTFIWWWIAQKVISWIIKIVIDSYIKNNYINGVPISTRD